MANVVINRAALHAVTHGQNGPVYRHITESGLRVQQEARRLVSGPLLNVRTGRGRAGIVSRMSVNGQGPVATISTSPETGYMAALHEGTRPHVITPKKARVLRFQTGGKTIYAAVVHHPGTRARHFLLEAAKILRR